MLLIQIFKKLLNVLSISDDKNASYMVTKKNVDWSRSFERIPSYPINLLITFKYNKTDDTNTVLVSNS